MAATLFLMAGTWWVGTAAAEAPVVSGPAPAVATGGSPVAVVGSTPAADARVGSAPSSVALQFSRPVTAVTVHVLGPNGTRVDLDGTTVLAPGGRSVSVTMQSGGTGGYLITWSARPAGAGAGAGAGALAFAVGRVPSWTGGGAEQFLSAGGASPALAAGVNVAEGIALAALLLLIGLVISVTLGWLAPNRRTYTALAWLLILVVLATAAGLALHGPFVAGLPAGEAWSRAMARATLHSAWGVGALLALGGVIMVGVVAAPFLQAGRVPATEHRTTSWTQRAALLGAALLGASAVAASHGINEPLAAVWTALVALHVASAVVLAAALLAVATGFRGQPTRYAKLLRGAVIAVAITGVVLAVHETGALSAITATTYGRVVLAKALLTLALIAAVFAITAPPARKPAARPAVSSARRRAGATPASRPKAQSVAAAPKASEGGGVELSAVAAVCFLAASLITAMLIFQTPGRIAAPRPAIGTLTSATMDMEYQLSPSRVGQNNIHLYILSADGSPMSVPGASADLAWVTAAGEPLTINLSNAGPGHFLDYGLEIPLAGSWTLRVTVDVAGSSTPRTFTAAIAVHP